MNIFPWSNFHELNLDWLLEEVKKLRQDIDGLTGGSVPSDVTPQMDGTGSAGSSVNYSRGDHVHPTDTSRASVSDLVDTADRLDLEDVRLDGAISAVDAKIKFSTAAPIMDSSSASAGISDYLARADHIHPTDTSRASATDLATLQGRVDAFAGSANPSDSTPLMDGVGSAGTGGNYARGDHVHPSDTSRLPLTGGQISGDLSVLGAFAEHSKFRSIETNAVGWVRFAQVPQVDGTQIRVRISREGAIAASETHEIVFTINQNGVSFSNERSVSDVLYIDKIRYNTPGGYLDLHVCDAAQSYVGVYIDQCATSLAKFKAIKAVYMEGVADAPAGETIVTTHTFSENGFVPYQSILTSKGDLSTTGTTTVTNPAAVSVPSETITNLASITLDVGIWIIWATARFANNATGRRSLYISNVSGSSSEGFSINANDTVNAVDGGYTYAKAFDYKSYNTQTTLYLNVWQNSGSSLSTIGRLYAMKIS